MNETEPSSSPRCSNRAARSTVYTQTSRFTPWYSSQEFDFVGRGLFVATTLFSQSSSSYNSTRRKEQEINEEITERDEFPSTTFIDSYCETSVNSKPFANVSVEPSLGILHQALQRVFVWQCRSERIPHFIEISASLAQVLLVDFSQHALTIDACPTAVPYSSFPSYSMILPSAYATSIVRAVNGIADSMQRNRSLSCYYPSTHTPRPSHSLSIAHLCSMLGLPSWIVHVRHDATHKELPSLMVLRLATQSLLTFMIHEYFTEANCQSHRLKQEAMSWLTKYENLFVHNNESTPIREVEEESSKVMEENNVNEKNIIESISQNDLSIEQQHHLPPSSQELNKAYDDLCTYSKDNVEVEQVILHINDSDMKTTIDTTISSTSLLTKNEKKVRKRLEKQEKARSIQEKIRLYGSFGILVEESTVKVKKKRCLSISIPSKTNNISHIHQARKVKRKVERTDRSENITCSKKFVLRTPMDIGYDSALTFFIWGPEKYSIGDTSHITPCGVLFQNQVKETLKSSFNHDERVDEKGIVFKRNKEKYTTLLRTIITKWSGFLHTFVVHLIECFVSMKSVIENEDTLASHDDQEWNVGAQVFYWVEYILSRKFQSMFNTSISIFKRINLNKIDVCEWSHEEHCFMASPTPLIFLLRFNLPIRSLHQRIQGYSERSTWARKLSSLFRGIIDMSSVQETYGNEASTKDYQHKSDDFFPRSLGFEDSQSTVEMAKNFSNANVTMNSGSCMKKVEPIQWALCESWEMCAIGTMPGYIY